MGGRIMAAHRIGFAIAISLSIAAPLTAAELPKITKVEAQPLAAQAQRIADALDLLGAPLSAEEKQALQSAAKDGNVEGIQQVLDPHCLAGVRIMDGTKIEVQAGPAKPQLAEQGWRIFLVKVDNAAGLANVELRPASPNSL